ncbi:MAG: hypothetical protein QME49_08100 [bacterium]|nr:hypothetical protein [bacterium]
MNKRTMQSLGITELEQKMLAAVPHRWVEICGGAVVFFVKNGKAYFLAYPLVVMMGDTAAMARFWEEVSKLPLVKKIEKGFFTGNPIMIDELAQWNWEKEV